MKYFSQRLIGWWFATMTPAFTPLTTIDARETMRKRHLFSVVVLIGFLSTSLFTLESILARVPVDTLLQNIWACTTMLIAGWINQRGYLKCASLFYLLTTFFGIAMMINVQSLHTPVLSFSLWPALLILPVTAQLFLPAWGPLLLGGMTIGFTSWFVLVERQSQIAAFMPYYGDRLQFLFTMYLIISGVGIFCAIATTATKKAVIQADRAFEIEQARQALVEAYTSLETAHATIKKQALTDALTDLPNHRAIMDQLEKELNRARRYGRPFSLLFFDADHFKQVNDTYGHGAGDVVLHQIGERANSILRGGDTLGRFGGEEFVFLLPEADASEASAVAERIRVAVASKPMATTTVAEGILMSISIGIATYPADGDGERDLLQQADDAMYLAKRLGRNQVRTAREGREASADPELMLLLQEAEQGETREQQGQSPEQIKEGYIMKMISSLMFMVEQRDPAMNEHSHRVCDLSTAIAQELTMEPDEVFRIGTAALLHDIGKVGLPDALLRKAGQLSIKERELLKEHPYLGAQILQTNPFLHELVPAVLHHHECWDGTGYPQHLTGEHIPLAARIIAVAGSYDTMLREHSYQGSHIPQQALEEMQSGAGTQFDPLIVQSLQVVLTHQQRPQHISIPTLKI